MAAIYCSEVKLIKNPEAAGLVEVVDDKSDAIFLVLAVHSDRGLDRKRSVIYKDIGLGENGTQIRQVSGPIGLINRVLDEYEREKNKVDDLLVEGEARE